MNSLVHKDVNYSAPDMKLQNSIEPIEFRTKSETEYPSTYFPSERRKQILQVSKLKGLSLKRVEKHLISALKRGSEIK